MARKHRRKIQRRKKRRRKIKKQSLWKKHLNSPVTNKYTKLTTAIIIGLEVLWVMIEIVWFTIDVIF